MANKRTRALSVSPDHPSHEVGACNACLDLCDEHGNMRKDKVWYIRLAGMSFRLCDDCMDEFVTQVLIHQKHRETKL